MQIESLGGPLPNSAWGQLVQLLTHVSSVLPLVETSQRELAVLRVKNTMSSWVSGNWKLPGGGKIVGWWHRHWSSLLGLTECICTWRWSWAEGGILWTHVWTKWGARAQWHEDRGLWDKPSPTAVAVDGFLVNHLHYSDCGVVCYRSRWLWVSSRAGLAHVGRAPTLNQRCWHSL